MRTVSQGNRRAYPYNHSSPRPAFRSVSTLIVLAGVVAVLTASVVDRPELVLAAVVALLFVGASVWNPRIALVAYAVTLPFEGLVLSDGPVPTVTKAAAIVFAVSYLIRVGTNLDRRSLPIWLWLWFMWAAMSLLWGEHEAIGSVLTLAQVLLVALLMADFARREGQSLARDAMWAYSLAVAVVAAISLIGFVNEGYTGGYARFTAFETQKLADLSGTLVLGLAFLVCVFAGLVESSRRARVVAAASAPIVAAAMLVTGTRSAWLASLGIVAVVALSARWKAAPAISALILTSMVLLVLAPGLTQSLEDRVKSALPSGGSGRTEVWSAAIDFFDYNPVLGLGYGNFQPSVAQAATIEYVDAPTFIPSGRRIAPHSIYVGSLVELGFVGFVLLGFAIGSLFLPRLRGTPQYLEICVFALLIYAAFHDSQASKYLWLPVALLAGSRTFCRQTGHAAQAAPTTNRAATHSRHRGGQALDIR